MTTAPGMNCIEISEPGDPDVLVLATRPAPNAGAGEVVIKVAAAGGNGPDLMQRKGLYPPPKGATDLLGLEVAGTVAEVRIPWPGGTISERPEVRREVVALYDEACRRLGVEPRPHA